MNSMRLWIDYSKRTGVDYSDIKFKRKESEDEERANNN
tara:strand:+ start:84 stop:197 length:114 start_codon:yes stop_codon:yes gene_type:complete